MVESHLQFIGSIPAIYDQHLGPAFFEYYARDLAGRLDVNVDGRVLETACGTGILTGILREVLPESVEIIATDLNEPMLEFAQTKHAGQPNVRFEQADAVALPYPDRSADAVVCQFGIMFYPDKLAGLRQAARVLKPGGQLIFSVWDSLEWNPIARIAHEAIRRFFTDDPPTFLMLPFGCHAIDPIKAMLLASGFDDIEIDVVRTIVERPSARDVAVGLVEGNPGIHEIRERANAAQDVVVETVAAALRAHFDDEPIRAPLQAIVFTARRSGAG